MGNKKQLRKFYVSLTLVHICDIFSKMIVTTQISKIDNRLKTKTHILSKKSAKMSRGVHHKKSNIILKQVPFQSIDIF